MTKSRTTFVIATIAIVLAILITVFVIKSGQKSPELNVSPISKAELSTSEIKLEEPAAASTAVRPINFDGHSEDSSSPENTPPSTAERTAASMLAEANQTKILPSDAESMPIYDVVEGNKLDAHSYEGFKLYRNWCARCHGTYGQGMVGPNLSESLNRINKQTFVDVVKNGKLGQIGSMPAWNSNPKVMSGIDSLYAYLKARADGAIGEIKPERQ